VQFVKEAAALREVQGQKAVVEGRINSMNRASDGIQQILAGIQADQEDWFPGSVEVSNPLPGVKPSSPFGMRHHPILGVDRLHAGCDMGAPSGTEIHAAADGIVVIAEVRIRQRGRDQPWQRADDALCPHVRVPLPRGAEGGGGQRDRGDRQQRPLHRPASSFRSAHQ